MNKVSIGSRSSYYFLWFKRFFFSHHRFIRFTPLVSILSLVLASASLALALSVYSGYETTLRQTIVDITGDIMITYLPATTLSRSIKEDKLLNKLAWMKDRIVSYVPFLSMKSLVVYKGQLSGALLEGLPSGEQLQKLKLQNRLVDGSLQLNDSSAAVIGRGLAKKWRLKVGDRFHLVVPKVEGSGRPRSLSRDLYVEGILDLGFYEFNSRLVVVNIQTVQNLVGYAGGISGVRLLVDQPDQTGILRQELMRKLGSSYRVDDWKHIIKGVHENYLQAIRREKFLIFFILMVLIVAGAFNVSSHLSISVLNQVRDISILKVMGASRQLIFYLFLLQGFLISFIGTVMGIGLGWLLAKIFVWIQSVWPLIPSDVYKVNVIITDMRLWDMCLVLLCSQCICLLACVLPAYRAVKLSIREGLLCE